MSLTSSSRTGSGTSATARQRRLAVSLAAIVVGCGGDAATGAGGTSPSSPGVHVVSGDAGDDTIDALSPGVLTARVIGANRRPLAGAVVMFEAVSVPRGTPVFAERPTMRVQGLSRLFFGPMAADTSNSKGEASVVTQMGVVAGPGMVIVRVPELGFIDTASFTVRAGQAAGVTIVPRDASMYVGARITPRVTSVDRYGNTRPDPVTISSPSSGVQVSDGTISASAIGRATVLARSGSFLDSAFVSVVPRGTVAVQGRMRNSGDSLATYVFNLDGEGFTQLILSRMAVGYFGEMPTVWAADGRTLIYHDNKPDHTKSLWRVDVPSGEIRRLLSAPLQLADERYPTRSGDGQWVYFNGPDYGISQAYRARVDGSELQLLSPPRKHQLYPHASPDGTRIVYQFFGSIEVMTLAGQVVRPLGESGLVARWSPSGASIAYSTPGGALRTMRPDGSGALTLSSAKQFDPFFDWSPDERYLIATADGVLYLVEVATGELLPVPLLAIPRGVLMPSWRP